MDDLYPVTIVRARYGGAYEPGLWPAWPLYEDQLPTAWSGEDLECRDLWADYSKPVGAGDTPQAAYEDLLDKVGSA